MEHNPYPEINPIPLIKCMVFGALIGLALISAFLLSAGEANPAWGSYWQIKPLLMVPFAAAVGGAFYYFMTYRFPTGVAGVIATIFSVFVFIIGLWLGTILGLNGTHWN